MKRTMQMFLPAVLAFAVGCGDAMTTTDGGVADMTPQPPPAKPQLGTQIERLGRGTINVAVTDPFDISTDGRDKTRDNYNKDSNESTWAATWVPDFETILPIYDGADGTCGNQLAADMTKTDKTRYATLATVFADDRLYLDTSQTTCAFYLAVEATALGVMVPDCGGRTPNEDVIDEMYTFATAGLAGFMNGKFAVTDGIPMDMDGGTASLTAFPFLADPL
jgi:hypothetical protein